MNDLLAQFERGWNPLILAGILAAVGGLLCGFIYLTMSGVFVGVLLGLSLCAVLAIVSSGMALLGSAPASAGHVPVGVPAGIAAPLQTTFPSFAAGGHASNGQAASSQVALSLAPASAAAAAAAAAAAQNEATETEAQLLALGKFDAYHLAKAKRLFAAGNMKEAAYQAGASMSHVDSVEAAALRKAALAGASSYVQTAVPTAATATVAAISAVDNGRSAVSAPAAQDAATKNEAVGTDATETEAQLLALGKFDAYHLAKAKRLFAAGNMKEAAYQAGASMSHVDSTEAAALRKAALAAAK